VTITQATAAEPLVCDTCYGSWVIDNVAMHGPGWCLLDLSPVWSDPEVRQDTGLVIPGVEGRDTFAPITDETVYRLPLLVGGASDQNGVLYDNPAVGLQLNREYLATYVTLPTNTGDGTRELVWTLPSGNTITTDITVLGLRGQLAPGALFRGTLYVKCSTGALRLGG